MPGKIPSKISKEVGDKYVRVSDTFVKEQVADPKRKVDVEIGDLKQQTFLPQIKTKHWDNECNLSVRLKDTDFSTGTVKTEADKIVWENEGRKARFYELPASGAEFENGGFEFDIELPSKPASNVLEFTIQTKDLLFFYQGELTEKEKAQGVMRPDNIIGSYAVYHATKKNNYANGKHYRTGKAFHIYRPYAEDANKNRVWCELGIDTELGVMTITVPQKFLDEAAYPILIDPTIGFTSVGGSEITRNGTDMHHIVSSNTTDASGGTVESGAFYTRTGSGGTTARFALAVYDNSLNLLSPQSEAKTLNSNTAQWITANFTSGPSLSPSTAYKPALFVEGFSNPNSIAIYFDFLGTGYTRSSNNLQTWPTWPDPFGASTDNNGLISFYITYSPPPVPPITFRHNDRRRPAIFQPGMAR